MLINLTLLLALLWALLCPDIYPDLAPLPLLLIPSLQASPRIR